MTDTVTGDATRPQPRPIDLSGIDPQHGDGESRDHLLGTTAAETAAGVTGVHHLGGIAARTLDRARRQVLGESSGPGVTVSHDDDDATVIDLDIVVEYPAAIAEVVAETRAQVTHAARQLADGPVRINVTVTDVHGPFDRDPAVLDAVDQAGETARRAAHQLAEVGDDLRTQAQAGVDDVARTAGELTEQMSDEASALAHRTGAIASQAGDRVAEFAAEADRTVEDLRERAEAEVGAADDSLTDTAPAARSTLDELDAAADQKLDELDAAADEKLDELEAVIEAPERPADEMPR
jgi:uncharacterized alkaline shock family protein YloU